VGVYDLNRSRRLRLSVQAMVEHLFPVLFGLQEFGALLSELVVARSIVSTASGESRAQLDSLVRVAKAHFIHASAVMVPQAHQRILRDGEVIDLLNLEILPGVLVDGGPVEETAGHIAMVALGQLEQLPLGLAHVFVVAFAASEVALVLELLQAGNVGRAGVMEALIGLHARNAPVVVVAVTSVTPVTTVAVAVVSVMMASVTSMTSMTAVTSMTSVTAVTSMTSMTSMAAVTSMVVEVVVVFSGRGLRRR